MITRVKLTLEDENIGTKKEIQHSGEEIGN